MLLRQQFGRGLMQLWLAVACLLGMGEALAQSTVSGTITGNTTLRAAQSPYSFQGLGEVGLRYLEARKARKGSARAG